MVFVAVSGPMMLPAAENNGLSEIEREVWALEEAYISAFKNARHNEIASMLHRDFLGWPRESERPSEKSDVARFLKENYPQPLELSFELNRAGIRVSGDVVITHYLVIIRGEDGDGAGQVQAVRITHTWIKEGAYWRILGGMSSTQQAEKPTDTSHGNA
jgi:ketosteroid isomerase-like protein